MVVRIPVRLERDPVANREPLVIMQGESTRNEFIYQESFIALARYVRELADRTGNGGLRPGYRPWGWRREVRRRETSSPIHDVLGSSSVETVAVSRGSRIPMRLHRIVG